MRQSLNFVTFRNPCTIESNKHVLIGTPDCLNQPEFDLVHVRPDDGGGFELNIACIMVLTAISSLCALGCLWSRTPGEKNYLYEQSFLQKDRWTESHQ